MSLSLRQSWRSIFYGRLRLIRSVLRASKFSVSKLIEIVILWVSYAISFGLSLFWHFSDITFQLLKLPHFWLSFTDEGSVPEMRIWSIVFIKSDKNGVCILVEVSFYIVNFASCINRHIFAGQGSDLVLSYASKILALPSSGISELSFLTSVL